MEELNIRTTITTDSVQRLFGPPGAIDYRSHPAELEEQQPITVFEGMKKKELKPLEDIASLKKTVYNFKNRKIVTRWIRDVSAAFHLKSTTLCLGVQLTDAFITGSLSTMKIDRCQLAAVTCLWIAAKFEEMDGDLPPLRSIAEVCAESYTGEEVLKMEQEVLKYFKWRLPHTTIVNHLFLQFHMLGCEEVMASRCPLADEVVGMQVLKMRPGEKLCWISVDPLTNATVKDMVPHFCELTHTRPSQSLQVFQVFGTDFLLCKRIAPETEVSSLAVDALDRRRFYVSAAGTGDPIFVDRGKYVLLRSINQPYLEFSDFLTQEAITHVEFLQVPSHVTALGVLGVTLCGLSSNVSETKKMLQFLVKLLHISATQALATADLLCKKYEVLAASPEFPEAYRLLSDMRERLEAGFDRKLAT